MRLSDIKTDPKSHFRLADRIDAECPHNPTPGERALYSSTAYRIRASVPLDPDQYDLAVRVHGQMKREEAAL